MKKLLAILILILTLPTPSLADDIRDFQIEGMSIGDSALDFLSEGEITRKKYYAYPLKEYYQTSFNINNSEEYTSVQISIKEGDKDFIISSIEGGIHPINFSECKERKKNIEKDILAMLPNLKVIFGKEEAMWSDSATKAITTDFYFNKTFIDGDAIRIMCIDRSKKIEEEKGWQDILKVVINSKKFNIFIEKNINNN